MRTSQASVERRLKKAEELTRAPTMRKRFQEVKKMIEEALRERRTPEAEAERKAKYEEICRIGELRGQAFRRGEPMDRYPLPWMTREALERQLEELEEDKELFKKLNPSEWEEIYLTRKKKLQEDLKERIELDKIYAN